MAPLTVVVKDDMGYSEIVDPQVLTRKQGHLKPVQRPTEAGKDQRFLLTQYDTSLICPTSRHVADLVSPTPQNQHG